MKMQVHELHPSIIHAPLTLLPTATVADLIAVSTGHPAWAYVGRRLWQATTLSAALSGVAGLAASQETKARSPQARDTMFLHGMGNTLLLAGSLGISAWRLRNRPSLTQCALGLAACGMALYTAWLGGELVYAHGVGVKSMPASAEQGSESTVPLFSRQAPKVILRDALRGLGWLFERARLALNGQVPVSLSAAGLERLESRAVPPAAYAPAHGESRMPAPPA